jgi:hypothetical protein
MHQRSQLFLPRNHCTRWQKGRCAVACVCLVMVCLLAGISAVHAHPMPSAGTAISRSGEPCELCAVAVQAALLFAILFLLLHLLIAVADRVLADPQPKSQFLGSSLWSRPPPSGC